MMRLVALAPLLWLGGCITLLPDPEPTPRVFVLEAGQVAPQAGPPADAVIAVLAPTGERALLGSEISWREGDELAHVARSQWSNRADLALQSLLAETLIRQQAFTAAVRAGEARADYELRWEVLDFEVDEATMQARFAADVKLVALPGRRIAAQTIIETSAPVSGRSASAVAQALTGAAREAALRISGFATAHAAQASAASISR